MNERKLVTWASLLARRAAVIALLALAVTTAEAQIGDYRNTFSVGVNGGYALTNIRFTPKVNQGFHGGATGGLTLRYTSEKYFNTICALQLEVNYTQMGWKEDIIDYDENPVINETTGEEEKYSRTINYIQVPVMAHLGWGREERGFQFFVQAGPQLGLFLSESTSMNFELERRNMYDRVSPVVQQDTMAVENKFDYGIAVGAGLEYSHPRVGHFVLEARYYYGLGNIYGDSKRDFFASSNFGCVAVKLTYLFDLFRAKR